MSGTSAAEKGARLLDRKIGRGWRSRIRRRELSMGNCEACILGQLFGEYEMGARALGVEPYGEQSDRLGFTTMYGYGDLTDEWRAVLRRSGAAS